MLRQAILDYIDHLDSTEYLSTTLASSNVEHVTATLTDLLLSPDQELVWHTTIFIRDSLHTLPDAPFSTAFSVSPLVSTLESLVLAENWWIRSHAIYTLGKTNCAQSLPAFHRAFALLRDEDPLLLPRLIGEIFWLEDEKSWHLLEPMLLSQRYAVRWAVIGALSHRGHDSSTPDEPWYQAKHRSYQHLRSDANPLVRAEADYYYQLLVAETEGASLLKPERRQRRRAIEQHKPPLSFDAVEIQFLNDLSQNGLITYTVDELEAFIATIAQFIMKEQR